MLIYNRESENPIRRYNMKHAYFSSYFYRHCVELKASNISEECTSITEECANKTNSTDI